MTTAEQVRRYLALGIPLEVPSATTDKVYEVFWNAGAWRCSCPAFEYGDGAECKHIKAAQVVAGEGA